MSLSLPKHPILLYTPLAAVAIDRLRLFFDIRHGRPDAGDWPSALAGQTAALMTGRYYLDAGLLARLPSLKAVCVLGTVHPRMDLPALTRQGVRVTRVDLRGEDPRLAPRPALEAAEQLIASLGFGRDGWHPSGLINPEVACGSCC